MKLVKNKKGGEMDLKEYANIHEAAALINRKESLIRTLCQLGRLEGALKIGKAWIIPRESVLNYRPKKRGAKPKLRNKTIDEKKYLKEIVEKIKKENKSSE